nr:uncharacterized protein LOC123493988 [Aegilops tauschii subsp. strangulata]
MNLDKWTCDCKKWDLCGWPCNHAVSAITRVKGQPEDYVHEFFKKPLYKETYKHIIYPVPGPDCWPRTPTADIDPPVFKEKKGRKQTARRKGQFEVPTKKDTSRMATITCSNYKMQKHRYTYCPQPLKPHLQARKDKHKTTRTHYHGAGGSSTATAQPATSAPPAATTRVRRTTPTGHSQPATSTRGRKSTATSTGPAQPAASTRPRRTTAASTRASITIDASTTSQAATRASGSSNAANMRGGRPYMAPRAATTTEGVTVGSKRKRFQSTRMRGYFYASGN